MVRERIRVLKAFSGGPSLPPAAGTPALLQTATCTSWLAASPHYPLPSDTCSDCWFLCPPPIISHYSSLSINRHSQCPQTVITKGYSVQSVTDLHYTPIQGYQGAGLLSRLFSCCHGSLHQSGNPCYFAS